MLTQLGVIWDAGWNGDDSVFHMEDWRRMTMATPRRVRLAKSAIGLILLVGIFERDIPGPFFLPIVAALVGVEVLSTRRWLKQQRGPR